jgi:glycerol-3-phosphate acyltransferase PlsY
VAVVVSLVLAYLLGTIPSAVVVARIATSGQVDIRKVGSGNPGAMNTLQQLGTKWGAVVLRGKGIASAGGQCLATFPVYAPIALAVTILTSRRRFEAQATMAAYFTAAVWVAGAVVWTVFDLPNLWGIEPGAALIAGGAISGLVIAYRFIAASKAPQPQDLAAT